MEHRRFVFVIIVVVQDDAATAAGAASDDYNRRAVYLESARRSCAAHCIDTTLQCANGGRTAANGGLRPFKRAL